ncbi:MAG: DUF5829 family protein [Fluviicola sp.]
MKYLLNALFVLIAGGACAQQEPSIRLNHLWIALDSTTYQAIRNSDFLKSGFAYSMEKQLTYWEGFYIIGKNTYLELFHPKSIVGEKLVPGQNWTSYSSLQSGSVNSLALDSSYINMEDDDHFKCLNYISYVQDDTLSPFAIYEMKQLHYEGWVKKEFKQGMTFDPVDYNSRAESDSSENYLFQDIVGITYSIPSADAANAIDFFSKSGYPVKKRAKNCVVCDNGTERIVLLFKDNAGTVLVNSLELKLRGKYKKKKYFFGQSKLLIKGETATWCFN